MIRKLDINDAAYMLEWMHDSNVIKYLNNKFLTKTLDDCIKFIESTEKLTVDVHFAIANDDGEYQGTVSLKDINYQKKFAEFAIVVRTVAMGKGYAKEGMNYILNYGKNVLKLSKIYWCVEIDNNRAVSFYDKNGYKGTNIVPKEILENYTNKRRLYWYHY